MIDWSRPIVDTRGRVLVPVPDHPMIGQMCGWGQSFDGERRIERVLQVPGDDGGSWYSEYGYPVGYGNPIRNGVPPAQWPADVQVPAKRP